MTENNVKKIPTVAKVFGWVSLIMSGLGMIGMILIVIASAMPSYQGSSPLIHSEDASKMIVFFLGGVLGYLLSPLGCLSGIISFIVMLTKHNTKKIWLAITGTVIGLVSLFGSILATVFMIEKLT